MLITIIGSGNVATVLARRIVAADHHIAQVISRNEAHAKILADKFHCDYAADIKKVFLRADIYVLAVADSALAEVAMGLQLRNKIAVHTAGSVSKNILRRVSTNFGVLYPLQTLRMEILSDFAIPLLIDSNTEETLVVISDFAKTISDNVQIADDNKRLHVHIAATIVNNFSNHLLALAEDFCNKEDIDFKLLIPLIEETGKRAEQFSPSQMQTGPAARNDLRTTETHLELLQNYPELKKLYQLFTESIQQLKR